MPGAKKSPGSVTPALLSISDAAAYLGVCPETMRWWLRAKRLPKVKLGRRALVLRADLDKWIVTSTEMAQGGYGRHQEDRKRPQEAPSPSWSGTAFSPSWFRFRPTGGSLATRPGSGSLAEAGPAGIDPHLREGERKVKKSWESWPDREPPWHPG